VWTGLNSYLKVFLRIFCQINSPFYSLKAAENQTLSDVKPTKQSTSVAAKDLEKQCGQ